MKRSIVLRFSVSITAAFVCMAAFFYCANVNAQDDAETDVAQSMGVGLKSRFASGATPVQLSRTKIVPGTPMSVTSTMSNMMSGNNNSFGGILSRYDTANFGKFFGAGSLAPRANASRVDALDSLSQGDNEVDNGELTEKMYPPRLVVAFTVPADRGLDTTESQIHIQRQIDNVTAHIKGFDRLSENVKFECVGSVVYLRGKVKSARTSRLLENIVGMQGGVEGVVNELKVEESANAVLDVFGEVPKKSLLEK